MAETNANGVSKELLEKAQSCKSMEELLVLATRFAMPGVKRVAPWRSSYTA